MKDVRVYILWRKGISLSIRLSVLGAFLTAYTNRIIYRRRAFCRGRRNTDKGGSGQRGWVEGVPESCKGRLIPPWSHLIDVPRLPPSKSYCPSCSFQSAISFHPFHLLCRRFHGIFPADHASPTTNKLKISAKSNFAHVPSSTFFLNVPSVEAVSEILEQRLEISRDRSFENLFQRFTLYGTENFHFGTSRWHVELEIA